MANSPQLEIRRVTKAQASIIYANEADVLNVAMFGMTARQWSDANPDLKGNIRDYASINELICLSNMESLNAVFIEQCLPLSERLIKLNQIAIHQMNVLESDNLDRNLLKWQWRQNNKPAQDTAQTECEIKNTSPSSHAGEK